MLETNSLELTPEEKVNNILKLKKALEENFLTLGQLLSELKRTQIFKRKGFKTYKEFVESEFNFSNSFASKLISTYQLYIRELDLDAENVEEIGLDKLNILKPIVKDCELDETEKWIERSKEMTTSELREEIKLIRDEKKESEKTMKDIFIEQYLERMLSFFNCNRKELEFKLALFFQDDDLEGTETKIKKNQLKFDMTNEDMHISDGLKKSE